jgi:SAM-dependent methyltransferase
MGGARAASNRANPAHRGVCSEEVSDLPFELAAPLVPRLRAAADVEGKLVRALEALGPLAGREVGFVDLPDGCLRDRLTAAGITGLDLPLVTPLVLDVPDESLDAVVTLWSAFRGVEERDLREADRVLRPGGRLLVVHDYGRDDVSGLRDPEAPEYRNWSRREGPFLSRAGFKIRVVHCFWTFDSLEIAQAFLAEAFGEAGEAVAERLKRPRLSWNVAVYHRWRGGLAPEAGSELAVAPAG